MSIRTTPAHVERMQDDLTDQKHGQGVAGEEDVVLRGGVGIGGEAKHKLGEIIRDLKFSDDEDSQYMSRVEGEQEAEDRWRGEQQNEEAQKLMEKQRRRLLREEQKRERNKEEMKAFQKRILDQKNHGLTQ